jgi:hypothetical protein
MIVANQSRWVVALGNPIFHDWEHVVQSNLKRPETGHTMEQLAKKKISISDNFVACQEGVRNLLRLDIIKPSHTIERKPDPKMETVQPMINRKTLDEAICGTLRLNYGFYEYKFPTNPRKVLKLDIGHTNILLARQENE